MKLLLTSAGVKNTSIRNALSGLLGKPIADPAPSAFPPRRTPWAGLTQHDFSMAGAAEWAAGLPVPGYAIDDQTAIKVTGGTVEVVSEGHWKLFTP